MKISMSSFIGMCNMNDCSLSQSENNTVNILLSLHSTLKGLSRILEKVDQIYACGKVAENSD